MIGTKTATGQLERVVRYLPVTATTIAEAGRGEAMSSRYHITRHIQ